MRTDQYEKLQGLLEKLTDVVLQEADPGNWPGNGVAPASWDQQTRGDRYWMKKNAAGTLTVTMKIVSLVGVIQQRGAAGEQGGASVADEKEEADGLDGEIRQAEKEATRLLKQIQDGAGKAKFDKKVHGKS